jgi:photosystem II stability/assembly factor-like uncharacterized protein
VPQTKASNREALTATPDLKGREAALGVATAQWSAYPLYGGEMTSIAASPVNPQIAWVGTRDSGVFKTTDGGASWQPARAGLTFAPIRTLRLDPTNPNALWAGTDFDGVWKSTDGGASWARTGSELFGDMVVFNVAIDPSRPSTVFAGLAGGTAMSIGAVFKSTDGGGTWRQMDAGIPRYSDAYPYTKGGVFALALNPAQPSMLSAGTVDQGAFRSTDVGQSWTAINDGMPFVYGSTDQRAEVNALAFDSFHGGRLSGVLGGSYFTFDAGAWVQRSTQGSPVGFMSSLLYFHPTIADLLFTTGAIGGLARSTDGGVSWQNKRWGVVDIGLSPAAPNTVFAARDNYPSTPGGVMKSLDLGDTWSEASQGITALDIQAVAVDPRDPLSIYAGTGSGFLFASHDGGQSWAKALRHFLEYDDVNFSEVSSIAVDPRDSEVITVAASAGLYRSTDRGANFDLVQGIYSPLVIAVAPGASHSLAFVGTSSGGGVYRSLDGGTTWEQKSAGLPLFNGSLNPILAIAIDPNDDRTVWAGTQYGGGILRSTDRGDHWQARGLDQENFVEAISVMPGNSSEILAGAGFGSGSIYKSTDGGATWQKRLADIGFVKSLVRDPRDPRVVYAGSEGFGVLRSGDGGETWQDYSGAIFYPLVYSLAISNEDPPLLLAGSFGAGLYGTHPPSTAPNCSGVSILPSGSSYAAPGGTGAITVTTEAGCPWTATSGAPWVTITSGASGSGSGTVTYAVASNTGADRTGTLSIGGRTFTVTQSAGAVGSEVLLFVPIVLDVRGAHDSHFTSELTLTNRGNTDATARLTYTGASDLGGGSGTATLTLPARHQRILGDAIAELKAMGVSIPDSGNRGGTLAVGLTGLASPNDGAVTVRTSTLVPNGRAGLAYAGVAAAKRLTGPALICGLRESSSDRSNVAFQNSGDATDGDLTLRVTVHSGDSGASDTLENVTLPPGGFKQISGVLASSGMSNGWVRVERVAGTAPYTAYGVVNDNANSDGSFVPSQPDTGASPSGLTIPVVLETGVYKSELVLTNVTANALDATLTLVADSVATADHATAISVRVEAGRQVILPNVVDAFRAKGAPGISSAGAVGALYLTVPGGTCQGLVAGVRTSAPGGGGRYGLFYPAVPWGQASTASAWLYGLRQDAENRANVALVNTGEGGSTDDVFSIELYDGDSGQLVHTESGVTLGSRRWQQFNAALSIWAPGVSQGYVNVRRTSGVNPFIAYAVVNDGGAPQQRSDDGAFVGSSQ